MLRTGVLDRRGARTLHAARCACLFRLQVLCLERKCVYVAAGRALQHAAAAAAGAGAGAGHGQEAGGRRSSGWGHAAPAAAGGAAAAGGEGAGMEEDGGHGGEGRMSVEQLPLREEWSRRPGGGEDAEFEEEEESWEEEEDEEEGDEDVGEGALPQVRL